MAGPKNCEAFGQQMETFRLWRVRRLYCTAGDTNVFLLKDVRCQRCARCAFAADFVTRTALSPLGCGTVPGSACGHCSKLSGVSSAAFIL
jgi:hypothetical protein